MELIAGAVVVALCISCIVICVFQNHDDDY